MAIITVRPSTPTTPIPIPTLPFKVTRPMPNTPNTPTPNPPSTDSTLESIRTPAQPTYENCLLLMKRLQGDVLSVIEASMLPEQARTAKNLVNQKFSHRMNLLWRLFNPDKLTDEGD